MNRFKSLVFLWLPVVVWCSVIFWLSGIPNLRISPYWWDYPLRKMAHMAEYALLARLVSRALKGSTGWSPKKIFVVSLLLVIAYSISDEYHQSFVLGRSGNLKDVLIDSSGAWIGLGFRP